VLERHPLITNPTRRRISNRHEGQLRNRLRIATSLYYIKWNGIQENVYNSGPPALWIPIHQHLGTAVAKGFDLQLQGPSSAAVAGCSDWLHECTLYLDQLGVLGRRCHRRSGGDQLRAGANPPWNISLGPQYSFPIAGRDAFVRLDWEYASRNPWLSSLQDSRNVTHTILSPGHSCYQLLFDARRREAQWVASLGVRR